MVRVLAHPARAPVRSAATSVRLVRVLVDARPVRARAATRLIRT